MMRIITRTVVILSIVSLFADIASEMLYPIIPVYLKQIGFSVFWIGVLEGVVNFTAGISKGYFGKLSDEKGVRLPFVKLGYLLSALSKPLIGFFVAPVWIFFCKDTRPPRKRDSGSRQGCPFITGSNQKNQSQGFRIQQEPGYGWSHHWTSNCVGLSYPLSRGV